MWLVVAINYALWIITVAALASLWLVIASLLKTKREHARRILALELEADLAVSVHSISGVPSANKMPLRIRVEWFWERMARRLKGWRKKR